MVTNATGETKMKCVQCKQEIGEEYSHADYERFGKVICWNCLGVESRGD
jgi:hypothetical protein